MSKHINIDSGDDPNAGTLEGIIDECGLLETLTAIALICEEKALHIESNWQDLAMARRWKQAAERVHSAAASKAIDAVS